MASPPASQAGTPPPATSQAGGASPDAADRPRKTQVQASAAAQPGFSIQ
jgi:pilus assembly protein CpaC